MNEPDLVAALAALRGTDAPRSDGLLDRAFPTVSDREIRHTPLLRAAAVALVTGLAALPLVLDSNEGVKEWNESLAASARDVGRGLLLELGGGGR